MVLEEHVRSACKQAEVVSIRLDVGSLNVDDGWPIVEHG
jgi:hypothetical protein